MKFDCPQCQQSLEAEAELEGQSIQCPSCGRYVLVPLSVERFKGSVQDMAMDKLRGRVSLQAASEGKSGEPQPVRIVGVDLGVWEWMVVLFKLWLASIPVFLVIGGIFFLLWFLMLASCVAGINHAVQGIK